MQRYQGIRFCNYGPGLVRTKTVMATTGARVFFQSIGRLFTRSPKDAGADIAELAAGGYKSGFYGPKLKRNESVWAQTHAQLGPMILWNPVEAAAAALTGAGSARGDSAS